jgi:hypothetical protein
MGVLCKTSSLNCNAAEVPGEWLVTYWRIARTDLNESRSKERKTPPQGSALLALSTGDRLRNTPPQGFEQPVRSFTAD